MISCFWIALMLLLVTLTLVTVVAALAYLQPRWFMAALRWLSPSVLWTFDTDMKIAALTIDDAPMEHINEILTVLKEYGVHATFFVIGSYTKTESGRAAIERILDEGHEIGHHSWSNFPSWILAVFSSALFKLDFDATHDRLVGLLNITEVRGTGQRSQSTRMKWFRPSHGFFSPGMLAYVALRGYRCVLGDVYPFDPELRSPSLSTWHVKRGIHPGAIVILHDRPHTPATLRALLPELVRVQGYRLETLSFVEQAVAAVAQT